MHTTLIKRWNIIKQVVDGRISLKEASVELGVSYRQAIRMKKAVLQHGIRGLVHGNTGKLPANKINENVKEQIVKLSKEEYPDLNDSNFAKQLNKQCDISVSRETVRKLRRSAGIKPTKQKRQTRMVMHHSRKPKEGHTILWYGLNHQWFPGEMQTGFLLAALDDATGRCLAARFFTHEDSAAYLGILQHVVQHYGIPLSIIQPCSPLLKRGDDHWSIEEQLRGRQDPTQVGYALQAFGIETVFASTKRQQRYLERVFSEFHVALVEEMQKEQIADREQGNSFLDEKFLHLFNTTYAITQEVTSVWKTVPAGVDLDRLCSFRYETTVGSDKTITLGDVTIPIDAGWTMHMPARSKVEARQLLDGSWRVYYKDKCIAVHVSTLLCEPRRMKPGAARKHGVQEAENNWVYETA